MHWNKFDPKSVAYALQEYQMWRRGEGKYAWNEDPKKNAKPPFSPKELGEIEDAAIGFLMRVGEAREFVLEA